jgi:hypothetical protein
MDYAFEKNWKDLLVKLSEQFGADMELDAILFLVGVQELGKGFRKFSKSEKMDLMHIAICKLLEPYGYYIYEGVDADGWPHYSKQDNLPHLEAREQQLLMKRALLEYFNYSNV